MSATLNEEGCDLLFRKARTHGDTTKLFPRSPRLDFDEACKRL